MKPSLDCPSRNDVDFAIKALEIEDEREKEALRRFYERERRVCHVELSGKTVAAIIAGSAMGACGFWVLLRLWLAL